MPETLRDLSELTVECSDVEEILIALGINIKNLRASKVSATEFLNTLSTTLKGEVSANNNLSSNERL